MSKCYYQVYLQQHVKGSVEDDYQTVEITTTYQGGRKDRHLAKMLSTHCGETVILHCSHIFEETDKLDRGLACVAFVCYNKTLFTDYNILYIEDWINGVNQGRREF